MTVLCNLLIVDEFLFVCTVKTTLVFEEFFRLLAHSIELTRVVSIALSSLLLLSQLLSLLYGSFVCCFVVPI